MGEENTKQDAIHSKGFSINQSRAIYDSDNSKLYGSIKLGNKVIEDATISLGSMIGPIRQYHNKLFILKAIAERNYPLMREISEYYYATNGIYRRVCDYFAFMYRFDWYVIPEIHDEGVKHEKVLSDFDKILSYLDSSQIKKLCGDIALKVIKYGGYYGYIIPCADQLILQELPINYCRSIFNSGNKPVVELDMRYFDENFPNIATRLKVLKMFPKEIQKGYLLYKEGKLTNDESLITPVRDPYDRSACRISSVGCWYPLDPASTVKFSLNDSAGMQPFFINSIPALIDLETTQNLELQKEYQKLQKIVIQELPRDKNGDLIFDIDEARDIHNNGVEMLHGTVGADVLTTFAKVSVEDISGTSASESEDIVDNAMNKVFTLLGISRNLFNTDSNLSLEKSILDDESTLRGLLLRFQAFFDEVVKTLGNNKKKYTYRLYMLETTQYNYKDMSKMYKEQVQMGYSKMLPQIALGHSQSSILHSAFFENEILHLYEIMIPPILSSTLSAETILGNKQESNSSGTQNITEKEISEASGETGEAGRPEKPDSEKSEKTIANRESM